MLKLDELEGLVIDALNSAIEDGFLLIAGEVGVRWVGETETWEWDSEACPRKSCDLLGAVLRVTKGIPVELHRGDYARAIWAAWDPEFLQANPVPDLEVLLESSVYQISQNLVNGWDSEDFVGGHMDAYLLGQKLSTIYRPLDIEVFRLVESREAAPSPSLDSYSDEEEELEPEAVPDPVCSGIHAIGAPVSDVMLEVLTG